MRENGSIENVTEAVKTIEALCSYLSGRIVELREERKMIENKHAEITAELQYHETSLARANRAMDAFLGNDETRPAVDPEAVSYERERAEAAKFIRRVPNSEL
ncbi:hypothetical protein CL65_gp096 [Mycobacterium phage Patience]|uniref:Uncharacterized protein n=2 Tax=Patiencevirus patience TaxID=1982360 RepID=A0A0K1LSD9_9CAUD|nr:hypothetical protein CL65_gp096 [Mycobacterium phage Patience]AEL98010.1 hypothetical protein PATIENCE_102 [Mycobacterium phage Patience]AKU45389.1 hypothetical protein MADRUGA_100 [Mycobacterium phage Madruga]UOW93425.1 hypothetical protein SEA_LABELLE_101 [Mycobacterium phage Labelle]